MSEFILQNVKILDPTSPHHQQVMDMRVANGLIEEIAPDITKAVTRIQLDDLTVSPGWCDLRAALNEPGFEYKDDLSSLTNSAKVGGFTDIAVLPNTNPTIQTRDAVQYIINQSKFKGIDLHPIAALTKETRGEQITEMIDLHQAGAKAFSDGIYPIASSEIMLLSLQYLQTVNGLLITLPELREISPNGQMHEGEVSTMLGTKAIPSLSEELAIIRDIELLKYTDGRIHFSTISTARGVELIRGAKKEGLRVTCDVAAHQLVFTDQDLFGFDTNLKVRPPFRAKADQEALWQGLADGTIDAICTSHAPHDEESKKLEFDLADFGILGLETAFAAVMTHRPDYISTEVVLEKLTTSPRAILGLAQPSIKVGQPAKLTLFSETLEWEFQQQHIQSKSKNTPFVGTTFKGKSLGIINGIVHWFAEELKS
ncbi:MAG: dihydroorotase [Flammeovirgaceae bacterium]